MAAAKHKVEDSDSESETLKAGPKKTFKRQTAIDRDSSHTFGTDKPLLRCLTICCLSSAQIQSRYRTFDQTLLCCSQGQEILLALVATFLASTHRESMYNAPCIKSSMHVQAVLLHVS